MSPGPLGSTPANLVVGLRKHELVDFVPHFTWQKEPLGCLYDGPLRFLRDGWHLKLLVREVLLRSLQLFVLWRSFLGEMAGAL